MSHSEVHDRRVKRLIERIYSYADAEGISAKTASVAILSAGKEIERLEKGGSTKPSTLEKYEFVLKRLEADNKAGVDSDRRQRARDYAEQFSKSQAVSA